MSFCLTTQPTIIHAGVNFPLKTLDKLFSPNEFLVDVYEKNDLSRNPCIYGL